MDNYFTPRTWKRWTARLVDEMVILVLFFPMWGFWYEMLEAEEIVWVPLSLFCFLLIFPMIFESVFLAIFQQTPGKWLLGLWVVPQFNCEAKLPWAQAILRGTAGRLALFFSWAPYALALFRYDRTHLIDWIAETRVIQKVPRKKPARVRWILGSVFVLSYAYEGFQQAIYMYDSIDWESRRVDIQEAFYVETGPLLDLGDAILGADEDED